jgi:hypothetical protein
MRADREGPEAPKHQTVDQWQRKLMQQPALALGQERHLFPKSVWRL